MRWWVTKRIPENVESKLARGLAMLAVMGTFWARPDLMVLLVIVIAAGVYDWRHPELDDGRAR